MNPIRTFIARPVFTGMLTLVLIVFGIVAYPRIGVDQFPEVEFPIVTVTTILPGADPETIERNVTKPLEEALNTLPGLDTLRSVNVENVSQIVIRFDLERKVDVAAQDVRDRVQATLSKLPREIQTPIVEKFDIGAAPVATLAFSAPLPIDRLTQVAEDVVKPALQQIPGVGAVELAGGRKREITVVVDPKALLGYGLTPALASADKPGTSQTKTVAVAELAVPNSPVLEAEPPATEHHDGDGHDEAGHAHGDRDPHVWHDPQQAAALVTEVASQLSQLKPAAQERITARAKAMTATLQQLDAWNRRQLATIPAARPLATGHRAFASLARAYGLQELAVVDATSSSASGCRCCSPNSCRRTRRCSGSAASAVCPSPPSRWWPMASHRNLAATAIWWPPSPPTPAGS